MTKLCRQGTLINLRKSNSERLNNSSIKQKIWMANYPRQKVKMKNLENRFRSISWSWNTLKGMKVSKSRLSNWRSKFWDWEETMIRFASNWNKWFKQPKVKERSKREKRKRLLCTQLIRICLTNKMENQPKISDKG